MTEIKLNLENLTEDERKTLTALVEKWNKTSKVWKPKPAEYYWFHRSDGGIYYNRYIRGTKTDEYRYSIGNCFRTQEEAEEAIECLQVQAKWKRLSVEAGEDENPWDGNCYHWCVYYDTVKKCLGCWVFNQRCSSDVYFPSEEALNFAIAEIGADKVRKYILGVKE